MSPPGGVLGPAVARLGRPELTPLVDELVRRFSQGPAPARLTLRGLPGETRRGLADLRGMDRLPPTDVNLGVDRLTAALGLSSVAQLRAVVEQLRGPLPDHRAELADQRAARGALWSWLDGQVSGLDLGAGPGRLAGWAAALAAVGIRGGADTHRARLEAALSVLRALPADGESLASFASDHAGDPHALDHGVALSALVLDAVSLALGQERPAGAEAARSLWEGVGVVPDPLSSTVLALGLPGEEQTPLLRWLAGAAAHGEPVVMTLANLRRWPLPPLAHDAHFYVVENPSLVAEAMALSWAGPPIVCSSGRPSVATVTLIRHLTAAGARAFQHADFDVGGLSITQWLNRQAGTIPWRMGAADYAAHASRSRSVISGAIPETPWDPALRGVLERERRPVYEEQVRSDLLAAMYQHPRPLADEQQVHRSSR